MEDSGTPETGTELERGSQKPGIAGGWSDDKVLDHLDKRMEAPAEPEASEEEPAGSPEEEPQAQKPTKKGPEPEEKPEAEAEKAEAEESEGKEPDEEGASEETEPEEAWTPESVDELAEALEMDPKQLLGALKAQAVIDGQAEPVTLQEALDGYQRQADYSRKMQAYQEAQKKLDTEQSEFATTQQQRLEELESMTQALWAMVPQESDADLINRYTDEDGEFDQRGFFLEKARNDEIKAQIASAWQYVQQSRQEQQNQQQTQLSDYREEQQRLLVQKDADFADTGKVQKFQSDASGLLKSVGYSEEEINAYFTGGFDHRHILLLKQALRMSTLEKGKKEIKKLVSKPKVTKPGTARSDAKPDRVAEAKKRLRKARSNKDRDAAAMDIIDGMI